LTLFALQSAHIQFLLTAQCRFLAGATPSGQRQDQSYAENPCQIRTLKTEMQFIYQNDITISKGQRGLKQMDN
jgi:hypothetical protein